MTEDTSPLCKLAVARKILFPDESNSRSSACFGPSVAPVNGGAAQDRH